MMHSIYYDSKMSDRDRLNALYDGQLFVFSPKPAMLKLITHARKMIEGAFGSIEPRKAQYSMPVEKYVEICTPLKPGFIHHPDTKKILQEVVSEYGCELEKTYIDVPRLRMVTTSPAASVTLTIRTVTPGIPPRFSRSTGGCRSMTSTPSRAWPSTQSISTSR